MFEIKIRGEKKETELIKIMGRVYANSARQHCYDFGFSISIISGKTSVIR